MPARASLPVGTRSHAAEHFGGFGGIGKPGAGVGVAVRGETVGGGYGEAGGGGDVGDAGD